MSRNREYVIRRANDDGWWEPQNDLTTLARTVFESDELVDIGIMDENGNKIMARERKNPIGYVWFDK